MVAQAGYCGFAYRGRWRWAYDRQHSWSEKGDSGL